MPQATLYGYKGNPTTPLQNGGECSWSSDSNSSRDTLQDTISMWMDASSLKNLDIKSIDSVVLSYQCQSSGNSSINHSFLKYRAKASGDSNDKVPYTESAYFPTSYTVRTHSLGSWTKAELTAGDYIHIYFQIYMAVPWLTNSTAKIKDVKVVVNYTLNSYNITVKSGGNGSVSGGGTFTSGSTATLKATPNDGYVFSHWSDGNTSATRTVTVTSAATYTAYFTRIPQYVTYDSIFNFQRWKDNGISASSAVVSNITNTGFTLTSNSGVNEGTATSPLFPVTAGKQYKIDIDITGAPWDVYIFFYDDNTSSGLGLEFVDNGTRRFSSHNSPNPERIFTAPSGATRAVIRVDANGSNNSVVFNNFRIYPAEYGYMSNSVSAEQRSNFGQWDMPTPVREGYEFTGWGTSPDGNGITYTEDSTFPIEDTVLYSQWLMVKIETIKFTSVEIEYTDPLVVNEHFVIKVGVLIE